MNNILPPFISQQVYDSMTSEQKVATLNTLLIVAEKSLVTNNAQRADQATRDQTKIDNLNAAITALQS